MERVTHENARFSYGGGQHTTLAAAEAALEMGKAVGRAQSMEIWINSPLRLDEHNLDMVWKLKDKKPSVRICNMPVRHERSHAPADALVRFPRRNVSGPWLCCGCWTLPVESAYREDAFATYPMQMNTATVLMSGPEYTQLALLRVFQARRQGNRKPYR